MPQPASPHAAHSPSPGIKRHPSLPPAAACTPPPPPSCCAAASGHCATPRHHQRPHNRHHPQLKPRNENGCAHTNLWQQPLPAAPARSSSHACALAPPVCPGTSTDPHVAALITHMARRACALTACMGHVHGHIPARRRTRTGKSPLSAAAAALLSGAAARGNVDPRTARVQPPARACAP